MCVMSRWNCRCRAAESGQHFSMHACSQGFGFPALHRNDFGHRATGRTELDWQMARGGQDFATAGLDLLYEGGQVGDFHTDVVDAGCRASEISLIGIG